MLGCVLRAIGDTLQPEEFLQESTLSPCNVFIKGERKSHNYVWETSGITIVVSEDCGDNLHQQVQDAIEFLRANRKEIIRLRRFAGLQEMELDFGVNRRTGFLQTNIFPAGLTILVGELDMGIELSIYGEGED